MSEQLTIIDREWVLKVMVKDKVDLHSAAFAYLLSSTLSSHTGPMFSYSLQLVKPALTRAV